MYTYLITRSCWVAISCKISKIVIDSSLYSAILSTPIKCLDLDDTGGPLKLEGWLYIVFIFYTHFNEEAPFNWQFGRGGTILLGKFGRRLMEFFYLCPKLCWRLAWVSFYGPCSIWRAGHLDQVILLVWPNHFANIKIFLLYNECLN